MAEITNGPFIGPQSVRPTGYGDAAGGGQNQVQRLLNHDPQLGYAGHDRMHYVPASFFALSLYVLTGANANTKSSVAVRAPFPLTIWAADVGCESAAGSAGTVDVLVQPAAGGGYVSVLDAPEDVKTGVGVGQRVAPEVDSEEVAYNDYIRVDQTGTGAGAMVGGQAHLWCQRK